MPKYCSRQVLHSPSRCIQAELMWTSLYYLIVLIKKNAGADVKSTVLISVQHFLGQSVQSNRQCCMSVLKHCFKYSNLSSVFSNTTANRLPASPLSGHDLLCSHCRKVTVCRLHKADTNCGVDKSNHWG